MRMKFGFTRIELIVALAIVAVLGALTLPAAARVREGHQLANCQKNLKDMGMALRLFAKEHPSGRYPHQQVLDCDGNIMPSSSMFDVASVYPEYLTDLDVLMCPSNSQPVAITSIDAGQRDVCKFDQASYVYTAWAISPNAIREQIRTVGDLHALESSVLTLSNAVRRTRNPEAAIKIAGADWKLDAPIGGVSTFPRLRDGIERFVTDETKSINGSGQAGSVIPVMWDAIRDRGDRFNHESGGANVLYLDGHVAFAQYDGPYGGEFPVNAGGMILHNLTPASNHHPG